MSNTSPSRPAQSLALSVYLPSAFMTIGQMALAIILPLYVLELGEGIATAALVFAMRSIGSMVVNIPASIALAKYGTRAVVFAGMALLAIGALGLAFSQSYIHIIISTFIFGTGSGTWLLSRLSYISHQVPIHRRGKAMSNLAGIQRFGMFVGPTLGGLGVQQFGYEAVFIAIAASTLLCIIPVWSIQESKLVPESTDAIAEKPLTNVITVLPKVLIRHRSIFGRAGIFIFALQFVREQRRLLLTLWGAMLGLDVETIGFVLSFSAVVDMLSFPIAGYLMDQLGRKVAGVSCILIMSIALGLLTFNETLTGFAFLAVLSGFGNGLGSGIILTLGSDFAPKHNGNQFLGVWRIFSDFGALSGPLLTSITSTLVVALNVTLLVGLAGGAALWFLVAETLPDKGAKH